MSPPSRNSHAYAAAEMVQPRPSLGDERGCADLSDCATLFDRTNALIRGLNLVLGHHGVHNDVLVALSKQVHDYLDSSSSEAVWLKRGKFLLSYPFSKYLDNELPEFPDCGPFVPTGILRSFMKARLLNYNRKNTHLWFSWMQCKRSCLPASDDMINENYKKHLTTLTKEDDGDDETIDRIFNDPHFLEHMDKIRAGLLTNLLKDKQDVYERTASLSASFQNSRSDGGAYSTLFELVQGRALKEFHYPLLGTELSRMTFVPKLLAGNRTRYNTVVTSRTSDVDFQNDWLDSLKERRSNWRTEVLGAKIQGIVEPMKVRVISKGPALEYYSMKYLQQALHSSIRGMEPYVLTGRPLCPTDIPRLYEKQLPSLTGDEEWISVDYSAATDNLSWKYSGRIFRYLIQNLSPREKSLAEAVLGPHRLYYPENRSYVEKGLMRRGQLMGSILSFVILCVSNFGLYLDVTRDLQASWSLEERERAVLVNGDDMLYLAPKSYFYKHIEIGKKVGLEMTVGKAYHHIRYTNVNSTCVDCPIGGSPYQINFLNTGLFYGQHKVMARVGAEEAETTRPGLVSVLPKVLEGSLPGRGAKLLAHWFNSHAWNEINRDLLVLLKDRTVHYRNIFIPIALGGMGVDAPLGWKFKVTNKDRRFAEMLVGDTIDHCTTFLPAPGPLATSISTMKPLSSFSLQRVKEDWYIDDRLPRLPSRKFPVSRMRQPAIPFGMVAVLA